MVQIKADTSTDVHRHRVVIFSNGQTHHRKIPQSVVNDLALQALAHLQALIHEIKVDPLQVVVVKDRDKVFYQYFRY